MFCQEMGKTETTVLIELHFVVSLNIPYMLPSGELWIVFY